MKNPDIFFNIFNGLFDAIALMIALFFLLIAIALFSYWVYSNFFSKKAEATVIGIRAYKKNSTIEDGKTVKTTPYNMYSPLLICILANKSIANGYLSSSQNWIPEKWAIGSKMKVLQGADTDSFHEGASYIFLLIALVIGGATLSFIYSIEINIYNIAILAFFLLRLLFKLNRRGRLAKIYDFIINARWKELKKKLPANKQDFFKRKEKAKTDKEWQKLSSKEITSVLKQQSTAFFKGTLPFMLIFSSAMLALAYYIFSEKLMHNYINGSSIIEIANKNPAEFAFSSTLAVFAIFIFLQLIAQAIRLSRKKDSPQPIIF